MEDVSSRHSSPQGARLAFRPGQAWFLLVAAAVVAADQLSKWGVRSWLERGDEWPGAWTVRLVHVTNNGAAFGILQGEMALLVATSVLGVGALLLYLFNPGFANPLTRFGLALMLGGAIGNLADRLRDGEVVDFLKFPHWPAFNLADSCISIGVVVLLWVMLRDSFQAPSSAT